jgi:hypothetical protein
MKYEKNVLGVLYLIFVNFDNNRFCIHIMALLLKVVSLGVFGDPSSKKKVNILILMMFFWVWVPCGLAGGSPQIQKICLVP